MGTIEVLLECRSKAAYGARVVAMDSHKSLCMPGRFLIYQKHGAHGGMEMCITVFTTILATLLLQLGYMDQ